MPFLPLYASEPSGPQPGWWFIFLEDRLLVENVGSEAGIPFFSKAAPPGVEPNRSQYIGILDGQPCYAASIDTPPAALHDGLTHEPLRSLFGKLPDETFQVAARAAQIMHWDRTSRFCGRCGAPMRLSATERAKLCDACHLLVFPRLSPAVIVAVVHNHRILLARSSRFPGGLYSVLAGFVEPGETLEACVAREVKEEAGIDVADIRYFGSQPWPFPDSLMIAFTARYAGGELCVDGDEIVEAGWYAADALPRIPERISVSRKLIDWFVESERR